HSSKNSPRSSFACAGTHPSECEMKCTHSSSAGNRLRYSRRLSATGSAMSRGLPRARFDCRFGSSPAAPIFCHRERRSCVWPFGGTRMSNEYLEQVMANQQRVEGDLRKRSPVHRHAHAAPAAAPLGRMEEDTGRFKVAALTTTPAAAAADLNTPAVEVKIT